MTTRRLVLSTLAAALALPPAARAHLPAGARGPHGGQVQDIGAYHGELLVRDGELTLFLFDHRDQALDARGASGTAVILAGGAQHSVTFAPRPDGAALVAQGDFRAAPGMRVVVNVAPRPGAARAQARFTPAP